MHKYINTCINTFDTYIRVTHSLNLPNLVPLKHPTKEILLSYNYKTTQRRECEERQM